jgi:rhodanese-related sulfurtransferase
VDAEVQDLRIDVQHALTKLEAGEAVALDVVQPGAWDRIDGVIKGAVRIPPEEIAQRFEELPRDLDIIAYCT